jgi:hypothetical protein
MTGHANRLDCTEYEVDLNAGHAKELRDSLSRYVDASSWAALLKCFAYALPSSNVR